MSMMQPTDKQEYLHLVGIINLSARRWMFDLHHVADLVRLINVDVEPKLQAVSPKHCQQIYDNENA